MTRMYIQPSWIDAASDHNEWSGGNGQYRGDRSADIPTFDRNGRARVEEFSDEAIANRKKAKPKTPIQSRIISQNVTLNRLDLQEKELEQALDDGTCSMEEYIQCKRVLDGKRARAIKSLNKALGIEEEPTYTNVPPEQENPSSSVFNLFKAGIQAIPEAVCKNSAKKPKNNFIEDAKMFLLFSLVGASILLIASH